MNKYQKIGSFFYITPPKLRAFYEYGEEHGEEKAIEFMNNLPEPDQMELLQMIDYEIMDRQMQLETAMVRDAIERTMVFLGFTNN